MAGETEGRADVKPFIVEVVGKAEHLVGYIEGFLEGLRMQDSENAGLVPDLSAFREELDEATQVLSSSVTT